jgi:hypothetical protein
MTDTARLRELLDEVDRLREALSGLIDKYQCIVEFGDVEGRSMTDEALVKARVALQSSEDKP